MTHSEDFTRIKHVGEHYYSSCASKLKVRKALADLKVQAIFSQEFLHSLIVTVVQSLMKMKWLTCLFLCVQVTI